MKSLQIPDVIDSIKQNYNLSINDLTPHLSSADPNARAFIAKTKHDSFFVKVKISGIPKTNLITQFLAHNGITEVVLPLKNFSGSDYSPLSEFELALFPYISGQDGFHKPLSYEQWLAFGSLLKKIHNLDASSLYPFIRTENLKAPMLPDVKNYIIDAEKREVDFDTQAIRRLIEKVEQLQEEVKNISYQPCFCHADIHGGNLLISDSGKIFIVDWDDPVMGPKELDLMFIGGGVENVWNKAEESFLFYQGYGEADINSKLMAYIRSRRILDDFAFYYPELYQKKGTEIMHTHFMNMFKPNGVIEIALKS